jgi:hypothetical protein
MKTELIESNEENQDLMELDPEGTLTVILRSVDGERLLNLHKAILLSIEEVGCCERSGSEEYRNAIWELTWLFRATMLDDSQTNVALGGRALGSRKAMIKRSVVL